uniref:Homing endonuclease LAGLIDADG domain-containing protein n=1 Tax=Microbotryum lychnidis-dioicae TaxID=288795 RepID=M1GME5_9BASI|nr:hypothetical protein H911_mgp48 [Microbotryum lychnidis-dioicae]AGE14569.1 hypothetical protein [Microbotryum lychnidis-dioicae]
MRGSLLSVMTTFILFSCSDFWDNPQVTSQNFKFVRNLNDCAPGLSNRLSQLLLNLGPYLAGLIEGDGTIVVPTSERSAKRKLNYPSIQIAFAAKDYLLALMFQVLIGHGSILLIISKVLLK